MTAFWFYWSNTMQTFGKIYNSFYELATDTGSLNASALDAISVYNDGATPVSGANNDLSRWSGHDSTQTQDKGRQAQRQMKKTSPPNTIADEDAGSIKLKQQIHDNLDEMEST
jgi:hypothetical protein